MERVADLLARLANLEGVPDEDLSNLEAEARALYDEIREGDLDAEALEALAQIADAIDGIGAENSRREGEREEIAAEVARLDARLSGETPTEPETEEPETEETEEEPDSEEERPREEEAPTAEDEQVPVLAGSARSPARVRVPRHARPIDTDGTPGVRMLAAPDLPHRPAGSPFRSWDDAAEAMCSRLATFRGDYRGPAQNVPVGTVQWDRPEERSLGQELTINQRRLRDVTSMSAVVAAGGICGPLAVRFGVDVDVTAARPVRDSLPGFTADRGGMIYQAPVGIGDVDPSAIGTLTAAQDAAGTVTKTIWCIPCSPQLTVTVDAIYERLCFSNFQDRYNPENMRAYIDVARAAWARTAERKLLASMRAQATNATAPALSVNSLRTLIHNAAYARAWYRDRYRLPDTISLVAYAPRWLLDMTAVDMAWQAPGDDTLGWTNAQVQSAVSAHGVRIVWTLESDVAGDDLTGVAAPDFKFPADFQMLVFPEGGFTFLDGGTLDFGIVRDSATNAANRFETFFESFEAVAKTGYQAFNVATPLCLNGAAAALVAQACANGTGV